MYTIHCLMILLFIVLALLFHHRHCFHRWFPLLHRHHVKHIFRHIARSLKLDSKQMDSLHKLQSELENAHMKAFNEHEMFLNQVLNEINKDKIDTGALRARQLETEAALSKIHFNILTAFAVFHQSLNTGQKLKLSGKLEKLRGRIHGRSK